MRFTEFPFFGKECSTHILRPKNTEICETEINKAGDKSQYKNEFIIHKNIINKRGNQITNMIQEFYRPILG